MKIQQLKKIDKNYFPIYKESETKEINIKINGCELFITEQQVGMDLETPHLNFTSPMGNISMDFDGFIELILRM